MKRLTLTIESFNDGTISEALKSIAETVDFDSPSGSGTVQMNLDVVAKWDERCTGTISHAAPWSYRMEDV